MDPPSLHQSQVSLPEGVKRVRARESREHSSERREGSTLLVSRLEDVAMGQGT
jgi:hypothetical protein